MHLRILKSALFVGACLAVSCANQDTSSTASSHHVGPGTGGNGGQGGHSPVSDGGGGSGGPTSKGPCHAIAADHLGAVFTAPTTRDPGYLGFGAWVDYPTASGLTDVGWDSSFPGCVASDVDAQTVSCDFGPSTAQAVVEFVVGLYQTPTSSDPVSGSWFSTDQNGTFTVSGTYSACVGKTAVGSYDGTFHGTLSQSTGQLQNLMFSVPE